jgi:zinc transport system substrate-binding protein
MKLSNLKFWGAILLLASCAESSSPTESESARAPTVYAVNYPLQYFAQRIGGEEVLVVFPAPPDEDPAFWVPDADMVAAYQAADLILLNGAGYAKWTQQASLPPSKLVDTSAGFRDRYVTVEDAVTHAHGPGGEHAHGDTAFTTWLDPQLAIEQARAVRDAFAARWPDRQAGFTANFEALRADLQALDDDLASAWTDQPLIVSHPVYQYLARRYDLDVVSLHWEPDEVPDDAAWRDLQEILARHPARHMIWEGEPHAESVRRLDVLGVRSVVFAPCGNVPTAGNYLSTMRANLENLRALRSEP